MKKTIEIAIVTTRDSKRKYRVIAELELTENKGKPCFSASVVMKDKRTNKTVMWGQAFESINFLCPTIREVPLWKTIYRLWEAHHLNDVDACANDEQREVQREFLKDKPFDYDAMCEYMKKRGVYEVQVNGKSCKYGAEWYYRPIPKEDLNLIKGLVE